MCLAGSSSSHEGDAPLASFSPRRAPLVLRGIAQFALLAAALADIRRRPADEINGSKWLWRAVAMVNFLGIGPIIYFIFGRKRAG